jgi:hypothetical protein
MTGEWERVWIPKFFSRTGAYIVERGGVVYAISKCCDQTLRWEITEEDGEYHYICEGCSKDVPMNTPGIAINFSIDRWARRENIIRTWVHRWTDIPEEDMIITVDGDTIE